MQSALKKAVYAAWVEKTTCKELHLWKKITLRNKNWLKGVTGWVKLKKKILELVGGGGFYENLKFIENLKSLAI